MKQFILESFKNTGDLKWENILLNLLVSVIIGLVIFLSYRLSHNGAIYSQKFNVTLLTLTVLTTTVMTVIGNNIALSLGMVGALSIVRFRTAIKDSRDTVYIFWTIIVGICCGVGDYTVAAIGSAAVFLVLLVFGRIRNDNRILLIIKTSRNNEDKVQATVFKYYKRNANLRVKNTTAEGAEFIYEMSKHIFEKANSAESSITDELYKLGDMNYVNIVTQNDEISS